MQVTMFQPVCNALGGHKKGRKIYEIIGMASQSNCIKVTIALSVFQTAKQTSAILTCPDTPGLFNGSNIVIGTDSVAEIVAVREAIKAAGFRCEPELQIGHCDDIENAVRTMSDFLAAAYIIGHPGNMSATYKFEAFK